MSDPWEDGLLYDLKNPPVMSMVVSRDDLYTIMATRMGKAADEIKRLRAAIRPFADCVYNDNGDVTIDTSSLRTGAWVVVRAVLQSKGDE